MRHLRPLHLTCLENRLAPAVVDWDGGGSDNRWTTDANWIGDVAPQPGDDLRFSNFQPQPVSVNDFPDGTAFGSISVYGRTYDISGNRVALANGLVLDFIAASNGPDARLNFPITLTAAQTFSINDYSYRGAILTGAIDLAGNTLTVDQTTGTIDITGVISGSGNLNVTGGGVLILRAANTYTGLTTLTGVNATSGPTLEVDGRIGDVVLNNAVLTGSGVVGNVSGTGPSIQPGDAGFTNGREFVGTLTTGNVNLATGSYFPIVTATGGDRLVVRGTVVAGGLLFVGTDGLYQPQVGDTFTLIDNDGADPIQGTFQGVAEGQVVVFGAIPLQITYRGGDGNDLAVTAVRAPSTAVGVGLGGTPVVNVYDAAGTLLRTFLAYDNTFRGGVHVAVGDVNNDGFKDIVTAAGVGGGPHVKVFDGRTGAVIREFFAYDANFRGGVNVAAARIDTVDGNADIITGAASGGGPHVKVFNGATGATISSFLAYASSFTGGVSVAGIDSYSSHATGSVPGRVVTGAGVGGGPHVRIFGGTTGQMFGEFFAYDQTFRGGVNVAAGFETFSNNGFANIVTAPGVGGGPVVRVFDTGGAMAGQFLAYEESFRGGVTVSAAPRNSQSILTGPASGAPSLVRQWFLPSLARLREAFAFDPSFQGGIFVG